MGDAPIKTCTYYCSFFFVGVGCKGLYNILEVHITSSVRKCFFGLFCFVSFFIFFSFFFFSFSFLFFPCDLFVLSAHFELLFFLHMHIQQTAAVLTRYIYVYTRRVVHVFVCGLQGVFFVTFLCTVPYVPTSLHSPTGAHCLLWVGALV